MKDRNVFKCYRAKLFMGIFQKFLDGYRLARSLRLEADANNAPGIYKKLANQHIEKNKLPNDYLSGMREFGFEVGENVNGPYWFQYAWRKTPL